MGFLFQPKTKPDHQTVNDITYSVWCMFRDKDIKNKNTSIKLLKCICFQKVLFEAAYYNANQISIICKIQRI